MRKRLAEGVKALKATAQKAAVNVKAQYADHQTEKAHRILQQEIDQLQAYSDTIPILKDQLNPLTLLKTLLNTDMLLVWSDKLETDGPTWKESFSNRIKYLNERKQSDNPHNLEKEPAEIQIAKDTLSQISTSYNTAVGERKKAIIKVKQRLAEIVKLKLLASDENLSQLKGLANTLLAYNPELKTSMDSFANLALLKSFEMDSDHPLSTINDSLKKSLPNISDLENQVKHAKVERFNEAFKKDAKEITSRRSLSIHEAARQVITHYLNGHINTNYQSCLGVLKHRARLTPIESIHNKTTGLLAFAAYEGEGKAYYPERLQQAERKAAEKAAAGAERTAAKNRETKEKITAITEALISSRFKIQKCEEDLGLDSDIQINDASNSGSATTPLDDQLFSLNVDIDNATAALARLAKRQEEMQETLDKTHSAINRLNDTESEPDQSIEATLYEKLCDQSKKLIEICETKCQLTFIEPADDSIAGNIDFSIPAPTVENSLNLPATLRISERLIQSETLEFLKARASNSDANHDIEIPNNQLDALCSDITEAERAAAEIEAAAETQRAEAQRQAAAETQRVEAQRQAEAETQRAEAQRQAEADTQRAEAQRQAEADTQRADTQRAEAQRQAAAETQRAEAQRQAAAETQRAETQRAEAQRQAAAETQRGEAQSAAAGRQNQQQGGATSNKATRDSFSEKWKNLHWGWKVVAAIAITAGVAAIAFGAHYLMAAVAITKAVLCLGGGSVLGGTMLSAATAYGHYRHIKSSNIEPTSTPGDPPPLRDKLKEIAETYQKKRKLFRSDSRTIILQILLKAAENHKVTDALALLILTIIQSKIENEKPRFKSYLNTRVAVAIFENNGSTLPEPTNPAMIDELRQLFTDQNLKDFFKPAASIPSTNATSL